ncbi:putative methyltransferase [Mycolicibacterium boenickei]|uniref:Methyltransferase n=2 Tax=Mycolicibacterium boenickei TaxID=146017 RepID=A0ABM7J4I9_9MYCO|nr:class I SAM-dependent methyltransferase [Mycolicibacterium boenickei]BBX94126.1 putative methyltransferase [Mycolicibacterium boenickei]
MITLMNPADYDAKSHRDATRHAYDQLAAVWSATTDDGPYNGGLERPALRSLVPLPLSNQVILDAGCGSGAQCAWLLEHGARPIGVDLSPAMIKEAQTRCGGQGTFMVADLAEPLPIEPSSCDGILCSLALHYLRDWTIPLQSFAAALRPGGWAVISVDHPFGAPLAGQQGGYFDTELATDTWRKAEVQVTQQFWRRPLAECINAFADAGFVTDRIVEARPSAQALQRWPSELSAAATDPSFIVYRLRLAS